MWGQDSPLDGIAILFYLFSFEEELTCLNPCLLGEFWSLERRKNYCRSILSEMATEAISFFCTYVPFRPTHGIEECHNHSFYILYGQKDRQSMVEMERKVKSISHLLKKCPAPTTIDDLKNVCFCILVEDTWHRARLEPFSANSVLISVFCFDYGWTQQVQIYCSFQCFSSNY